jgi:hypothetical protein
MEREYFYRKESSNLQSEENHAPGGKEGDTMDMKRGIAFGMISVFLLVPAASAPAAEAGKYEDGVPSTAVARLKIGKGTAWVRSSGSAEWEESADNFPLVEKSRVSIPQGSAAEIQFRGSQSLHLEGGSEVDIRQLGDKEVSYRLRSGRADLSLPKEDFAPVRITVPGNREVRVDTPGRYSLAADRGTTRFLVRAGKGAVTGEDGSPIPVQAGEEASIGENIRVRRLGTAASEPAPETETTLTGPEADAGVPPAVAGELREYGEWVPTKEYGYAWRPYVEDGWEPYYYGRWVWVVPYGWTWVGYEPWGWWPYHTGWWWPSPLYGWVWCPFHSFVSVQFAFGHSIFFGHHARFFPANVRFVGRDRFVRWVPSRPGERRSDFRSFARGDSRLARWDRPVERGSVRVRTTDGVQAVRSPASRGGNAGITRPRSGYRGDGVPSVRSGRSSQTISGSGGRITSNRGNSGFHRRPGRPSAGIDPATRAGGISREPARGGFSRSSAGMGSRGPAGSFRNSFGGGNRGFSGGFRGGSGGGTRGSGGPR